jgi:hypothetical protein
LADLLPRLRALALWVLLCSLHQRIPYVWWRRGRWRRE